jgi:hypothetical protein
VPEVRNFGEDIKVRPLSPSTQRSS